ncbi:MAG: SDR family NAD(P)-dependent oxidoreductase [Oscillibacter sp.]|jgi:short-subunit dehydrogenase|nr:SDR family NAD(P)-dependent oxidoreductase [Oscillibacter sp.]
MKTAVVTGASSGLGTEFVRQIPEIFPEVECLWLIARRREKLEQLAAEVPEGLSTLCLTLDLCDPMSFAALQERLSAEKPELSLLVNCAGCGYLGRVGEMALSDQCRMIDLNVRALSAVTAMALPYLPRGGRVLNVSSIAAFCSNPRMTVYSASKAYVSSFTLGLGEELKARGAAATAVCPGPMRTEFLDAGGITGNSRTFELLPYCDQVRVAGGALRAARAGRGVYTPRAFYKFYRAAAKLVPQQLMVKLTGT